MPATSTLSGEPVRAAEEDRGAVLSSLQRQVADLRAQLRTPSTVDPHPGGRAAARGPEPSLGHPPGGRVFFEHRQIGDDLRSNAEGARVLEPPHVAIEVRDDIRSGGQLARFATKWSVANYFFHALGQLYFFHALLFSLNVAPFIFTPVLAWPIQCLRDRGLSLLAYLDDIVIWHRYRDTLLTQVHHTVVSPRHGVSPQLGKVSSIPHDLDGLARRQVVPSNGPLATSQRVSVKHPCPGAGPALRSLGHQSSAGTPRRGDQFCVSSAPLPPSVVTTAHRGQVASLCGQQGRTGSPSPGLPCSSSVLVISGTLAPCSSVSCPLSATLSLDGCIRPRLEGPPRTVSHGRGSVVSFRMSTSCQCSRTTGCSPGGVVLRPPPSGSSVLYRQ